MTERPRRPPQLILALIALPVAAMLFGMAATNLGGPGSSHTGPASLALLFSLFGIRFSGARTTSVAILAFLTMVWLPGAISHAGDSSVEQAAYYVLIGTVLFVTGAVLSYLPASIRYYDEAIRWRALNRPLR
ncbi:hypothetical protein NLX83_40315 [Allokutzneria sp. A3M-2-11 16]|uniref:hypothetical protein n=1 Tax=Allokutzneria sp. A3M-2-11 16 TaxID=2962043 RepID=UPI0020B7233D|nr:hypothetical protein [Allokutzneria sp. A3M-2-11 16]MCP3805529.1 hypothetical protein [Allokutzneria sp. A3M-2-11 16]